MTPDQTRAVLLAYQDRLSFWEPKRYAHKSVRPTEMQQLQHTRWMVEELLSQDDLPFDKVNRWLGFIQGVLWSRGKYSIDDMRHHNMGVKPDDES